MEIINERLRVMGGRLRSSSTCLLSFRKRKSSGWGPGEAKCDPSRHCGYHFPNLFKFKNILLSPSPQAPFPSSAPSWPPPVLSSPFPPLPLCSDTLSLVEFRLDNQWKENQQSSLKVLVLLLKKKKYNQVLSRCVLERKISLKILSLHHHHHYYYINNINRILKIETALLFWTYKKGRLQDTHWITANKNNDN